MNRFLDLTGMQIIDLSYKISSVDTHGKLFIPKKIQLSDGTLANEVTLSSHCGTHTEFPDHYYKDGRTAADYSIERFITRCLLLDCEPGRITLHEATRQLDVMRPGDSVLIRNIRQYEKTIVTEELAGWLAGRGISTLGIDFNATLGENISECRRVHELILEAGGLLLEGLDNLNSLVKKPFVLVALPWKAELDSTWTRALAII